MTETLPLRELLAQPPQEVLACLPQMGRVMLSARAGGATHERIGLVEAVEIAPHSIRLGGTAHDGVLDLGAVARLAADRSGRMRDKVLPRLECLAADGETLFSLIALDGLESFDAALAPFGRGEALEPAERPAMPGAGAAEVPPNDLGALSFAAIRESGLAIAVELRRRGLLQSWGGVPPEVKPAMGFVNLIQADFHLHLKAGAIASWRRLGGGTETELHAEDEAGEPIGLVLRGPEAAFAGVPERQDAAIDG